MNTESVLVRLVMTAPVDAAIILFFSGTARPLPLPRLPELEMVGVMASSESSMDSETRLARSDISRYQFEAKRTKVDHLRGTDTGKAGKGCGRRWSNAQG